MIETEEISILLRLILAHLLTEFVLQPIAWKKEIKIKRYRSEKLYVHAFITAVTAYIFAGLWTNLWIPILLFISHLTIGIWRSYQPEKAKYFILGQLFHMLVLTLIFLSVFNRWSSFWQYLEGLYRNNEFLALLVGYMIVSWPLGLLIGIATEKWRNEPGVNTDGLAKAGMWIGLLERFLIFTFILIDQYTAIGLLIAAKSVLRFNDKENNTQKKTEYVLIGTLMSFSASLVLGVSLKCLFGFI